MKLTEIYEKELFDGNIIKESVNYSNADAKNAIRYLQNALRSTGSANDKYEMLAFIVAAGLLPSFNNKINDVWNFMKFFANNANKGVGFRMNQNVEAEIKKQFKIK